mmetsp:Transcript_95047/g.266099  ORF Transcript_95047/g.266099 Transcript_95047/m.266099 type:complete len:234 (-) Transcript_95047:110-811(-)
MTPQTSKLAKRVVGEMTAWNQDVNARCAAAARALDPMREDLSASPGNLRPQPRVCAKSFAVPRGSCARAGKDSDSSSSLIMNPLPESFKPSSARESSAWSARKRMNMAKEAVPSPPPDTSRALLPRCRASRMAPKSSARKTSSAPPRLRPLTTSMMLKARDLQYGVFLATDRMSRPAMAPACGLMSTTVGTCSSALNAGSRASRPYKFAGVRPRREGPTCRSSRVRSSISANC